MQRQFDELIHEIKGLHNRVLEAYGIFKKTKEADRYVLGQGPTIEKLESRYNELEENISHSATGAEKGTQSTSRGLARLRCAGRSCQKK
jgi:hypothetical protein